MVAARAVREADAVRVIGLVLYQVLLSHPVFTAICGVALLVRILSGL